MSFKKLHSAFKIAAFSLALLLLVPTVVKFNHIFAHHKHDICLGETATHLHELNTDCDFYKFKLTNNTYTHTFLEFDLFLEKEPTVNIVSQYHFLSKYQRLQIALRGPPALIY